MVPREGQELSNIERAPLIDVSHQYIELIVKINGKITPAILDIGFLVTLISQKLYNEKAKILEERVVRVKSDRRRSFIDLFSCGKEQNIATSVECDVKI